jgi:hypothetical protein
VFPGIDIVSQAWQGQLQRWGQHLIWKSKVRILLISLDSGLIWIAKGDNGSPNPVRTLDLNFRYTTKNVLV